MKFDNIEVELQSDVLSVQKIPIISTILDVICRTTGMGFSAVARVTNDKWITCSLLDNINFGLKPGDELKVEMTLCHQIKQNNTLVVIDNVDKDENYCMHPIPRKYGFQSYISVPIYKKDGSFFGTLCAIDTKPARLNTPEVIGMFTLFSELISFHLSAVEQIELNNSTLLKEREEQTKLLEQKNEELQKMNMELESFASIASHDLQEPLRKIETFSGFILKMDYDNLTDTGKQYFNRLVKSVKRMQILIRDLITYTQVKAGEQVFKVTDLNIIAQEVKQYYNEEISQKNFTINVGEMCTSFIIPFQLNQLFENLISNSIKFSKPGIDPIINISSNIEKGNHLINKSLIAEKDYCHITISDNGIGFESQYRDKIFEVFQRLNGRDEYEGTGIGLSIVKKIVDNHHGFITATSEPNEGAKFDIYLPQP